MTSKAASRTVHGRPVRAAPLPRPVAGSPTGSSRLIALILLADLVLAGLLAGAPVGISA